MRPLLAPLLVGWTLACSEKVDIVAGEPGAPLPGLTAADSQRFYAGMALFNKVYTADDGLGPAFNENQCSACHTVPAIGGTTGFERVVKATRSSGGSCDLLSQSGGENIRTNGTPRLRARGVRHENIPATATDTGRFHPPFLFGLGLVEQIPDDDIASRADPDDRDGDGISGRAARDASGRLTRFGRKADNATIEDFTRGALRLEMGLTTRAGETDRVNGAPPPHGTDPTPEPEVDSSTVTLMRDFVRFLAPPAPESARNTAVADTLALGEELFSRLACARCHTPVMRTGPSDNPALNRKAVALYSDLLLHDMGPALSNTCTGAASRSELRTALLMGLGHRQLYLHDGRVGDLREAILAHGGEAQASRDLFARLGWLRQEYVVRFLRSR